MADEAEAIAKDAAYLYEWNRRARAFLRHADDHLQFYEKDDTSIANWRKHLKEFLGEER